MKFQNLSVKRLFGRVALGLVLSMSGITIALFFVTKQIAVLLTGGALLLCALVVLSMFAGCAAEDTPYVPTGDALFHEGDDLEEYLSSGEEEIDVLTLGYYPDRSMNPLIAATYTNRVPLSLIYQGLFAVSNDYVPTPILCSRYQVDADNLVWTFYVEVSATFSDGSRVTVDDVVASGTVILEPPSADGGSDDGLRERSLGPSPAAPAVVTPVASSAPRAARTPRFDAVCTARTRLLRSLRSALVRPSIARVISI